MSSESIHPLPSAGPLAGAGAGAIGFSHTAALSPQTTGGLASPPFDSRTGRRGPVLLRGGFGEQRHRSKPSASSSPSHSPIRDFQRLGLGPGARGGAPREGKGEEELEGWARSVSGTGAGGGNGNGSGNGARFRSLGSAAGQSRQRGSLPPLGYMIGGAGGAASQRGEEEARTEEEEERERGRGRGRDRVRSEGSGTEPEGEEERGPGPPSQMPLGRDW